MKRAGVINYATTMGVFGLRLLAKTMLRHPNKLRMNQKAEGRSAAGYSLQHGRAHKLQFQTDADGLAVYRLLHPQRRQTTRQKAVFCNTKDGL